MDVYRPHKSADYIWIVILIVLIKVRTFSLKNLTRQHGPSQQTIPRCELVTIVRLLAPKTIGPPDHWPPTQTIGPRV